MRVIVVQGQNGLHRAITHILISRDVFFSFVLRTRVFAVRGVRAPKNLLCKPNAQDESPTLTAWFSLSFYTLFLNTAQYRQICRGPIPETS